MTHDEQQERRLEELARRLGARAADRLDVERTAAGVVRRLRELPATRMPWLRIAAAVVVLLGGGFAVRELVTARDGGAVTAYLVADDLADLTTEELEEVLAVVNDTTALGFPGPRNGLDAGAGLDELDSQQLRVLLRNLEG